MNSPEAARSDEPAAFSDFSPRRSANFMIGRARFARVNREMPRRSALNRLGEPCKAARCAANDLLPPQRRRR
jgi:hypothetical protein